MIHNTDNKLKYVLKIYIASLNTLNFNLEWFFLANLIQFVFWKNQIKYSQYIYNQEKRKKKSSIKDNFLAEPVFDLFYLLIFFY